MILSPMRTAALLEKTTNVLAHRLRAETTKMTMRKKFQLCAVVVSLHLRSLISVNLSSATDETDEDEEVRPSKRTRLNPTFTTTPSAVIQSTVPRFKKKNPAAIQDKNTNDHGDATKDTTSDVSPIGPFTPLRSFAQARKPEKQMRLQ